MELTAQQQDTLGREMAYRRGVHQALFEALSWVENATDLNEATRRLRVAVDEARRLRSQPASKIVSKPVMLLSVIEEAVRRSPQP